jgi:hypothetical protein
VAPDALEQPRVQRTLRAPLAVDHLHRHWLLANTAQWSRVGETKPNADIWAAFSTPVSRRRGVAKDFTAAIADRAGVVSVWATALTDDLEVAVELADPDAESDLRNIFIDLVCERLDPSEGELAVFTAGHLPAWVQNGTKLT